MDRAVNHFRRLAAAWDQPVDGTLLSIFRVAAGLGVWLQLKLIVAGLLQWGAGPPLFLQYPGVPDPFKTRLISSLGYGPALNINFTMVGVVAVSSVAYCVGFQARAAAAVCFVGLLHFFCLDASFYQESVFCLLLALAVSVVVPMDRAYALSPSRAADGTRSVAASDLDWLRGLFIYVYLAKGLSIVALFSQADLGATFEGLVSLGVVPLLLWRRSRLIAIGLLALFHAAHARLTFHGSIHFWMLAGLPLFLPPEWPERLRLRLARRYLSRGTA